jgi:DNA-binding NtrC family response regulator
MPERPGLVGEAEGGTLFLDEVGELGPELQTHLLRVLDEGAEYQRLGESRRRVADFRLVAATNRAPSDLRTDLAARLTLRIEVPGLDARREDIPLLAAHLLRRAAAEDRDVERRFFEKRGATSWPRLAARLALALVGHAWRGHVRELDAVLWRSLEESEGDVLELTPGAASALGDAPRPRSEPTADEIRAALARAGGVQARAWKDLGLPNRFALQRLLKAHGIKRDAE